MTALPASGPRDVRVALALATTIAVWASAFAAIREALGEFTPGELSVFRLAVASVALALVAAWRSVGWPSRADVARVLAVGVLGMTAYQLLLNSGEQTVEAGTASILVATAPIFVALLAGAAGAAPMGRRRWTGTLVAFAGSAAIALGAGGGVTLSAGAMLVLAAAVCQAAYFVVQRPLLERYSAFQVTAWAMWAGTALSIPWGLALPARVAAAEASATLAVVWLGVAASALGFVTWAYAAARVEVRVAASTLYLVPPVAMTIGWVWLGETPAALSLAGGALVLAGVALVQRAAHTISS